MDTVTIGAVLLAGALASGDVAGNAAPAPRQQADRRAEDAKPAVDIELILAVDVSYSMDMDELAIQREGYAQAIVSKEFLQALKSGPTGKIAVTYFERKNTATLQLYWQPPGKNEFEIVPASAFSHAK